MVKSADRFRLLVEPFMSTSNNVKEDMDPNEDLFTKTKTINW